MNVTLRRFAAVCLVSLAVSCANVTPTVRDPETVSYDGNQQTAGVIAFLPDGSLLISGSARMRYNGLVAKYGGQFTPRLRPDFGVATSPGGSFSMTLEAADKWHRMSLMEQEARINR